MLAGGVYPGMITATIGTALLLAVVADLVRDRAAARELRGVVRRSPHGLRGIALAWFHQIPTGNELVLDRLAADYWRGLYLATLAILVVFRLLVPFVNALPLPAARRRGRRRGRRRRLAAHRRPPARPPGREGRASSSSGGSSRAAAGGRRTRSRSRPRRTAARCGSRSRRLGDFTSRAADVPPGRAWSPKGRSASSPSRPPARKVPLIAGGIGITPIRSLLEEMDGDLVVVYRVVERRRRHLRRGVARRSQRKGAGVARRRRRPPAREGSELLSPAHLRELVPDIAEREVFVCGPPAMADATAGASARPMSRPATSTPSASRSDPNRSTHATSTHGSPRSGDDRAAHGERRRRGRGERRSRPSRRRRWSSPARSPARRRGRSLGQRAVNVTCARRPSSSTASRR